MRKNYLSVCAGLALVTSGAALAQIPAPMGPAPGQSDLGALDTDRDGSISRTEATMNAGLSAQFPMLDKNSNGALEPAEFARFESAAGMGRLPTAPNPPASLQLDTNTPAPMTTPPPMNSTPPPIDSTPPPIKSTPPPLGTSPPPPKGSKPPGSSYAPRSATSAGGPGDED